MSPSPMHFIHVTLNDCFLIDWVNIQLKYRNRRFPSSWRIFARHLNCPSNWTAGAFPGSKVQPWTPCPRHQIGWKTHALMNQLRFLSKIHIPSTFNQLRSTQDVVTSVSYQCRQLDFPFNRFSNMINHAKIGLNHDFLLHGYFSPIRCKKPWTISHNFFWKNPKWTIFQCRFRQNSDAGTWVNQPPVILSSSLQRWQQWHTNEPIEPRHIPFRNIFRSNQPKRTILENNIWCPTDTLCRLTTTHRWHIMTWKTNILIQWTFMSLFRHTVRLKIWSQIMHLRAFIRQDLIPSRTHNVKDTLSRGTERTQKSHLKTWTRSLLLSLPFTSLFITLFLFLLTLTKFIHLPLALPLAFSFGLGLRLGTWTRFSFLTLFSTTLHRFLLIRFVLTLAQTVTTDMACLSTLETFYTSHVCGTFLSLVCPLPTTTATSTNSCNCLWTLCINITWNNLFACNSMHHALRKCP